MPMRAGSPASPATAPQAITLLVVGVAVLVLAGVAPNERIGWLLESTLPTALLVSLGIAWPWLRLSPGSYLAILALLAVHELGAHYSYAQVPYDDWLRSLSGRSLDSAMGWQRNQYDRLVHLSYGVLITAPLRESLQRLTPLRGSWLAVMTLSLVLSTSALYELIEWVGGEYLGDDQAKAFVATQQDPWDAQKDMALALVGSLLSLALCTIRNLIATSRKGRSAG